MHVGKLCSHPTGSQSRLMMFQLWEKQGRERVSQHIFLQSYPSSRLSSFTQAVWKEMNENPGYMLTESSLCLRHRDCNILWSPSCLAAKWSLCLRVDELHRQGGEWCGGHPHPEHPAVQVRPSVTWSLTCSNKTRGGRSRHFLPTREVKTDSFFNMCQQQFN